MTLDRLPPHDIAAEEAVLAASMLSADALTACALRVTPVDFFREKNGWVFAAILDLWTRQEPVNTVTVGHELARRERLDAVGGYAYLSRLTADLPTTVGAEWYAENVARDATYRRMISAGGQIAKTAYQGGADLEGAIGQAEGLVAALRTGSRTDNVHPLSALLSRYLDTDPGGAGIPTGFPDLDTLLGGLKRSDLILLAARPSVGKSALALAIGRSVAGAGGRVVLFSLEMSAEQLTSRLLAAESGVDATRLRLGTASEAEEKRVMHAIGALTDLPLAINDTPALSLATLRGTALRQQQSAGLDLVIVDYLQLLKGDGRTENRVQEISAISRGLKALARELRAPVLALSQLSRAVESRKPPIPMMSDLRDSGALEQDADVVLFLYREGYLAVSSGEWAAPRPQEVAQVIVAKHRNGPVGTVDLVFARATASFRSMAHYTDGVCEPAAVSGVRG